jgi:monoamine oxidase
MAPHAKFFAIYDRPFWRDAGFSGTAQSFVGPLGEIHDATTASGKAALFGFPSAGADARAALGELAVAKACLAQLARRYGPEALHARSTLIKDWAADPLTATEDDRSPGGHPISSAAPWGDGVHGNITSRSAEVKRQPESPAIWRAPSMLATVPWKK